MIISLVLVALLTLLLGLGVFGITLVRNPGAWRVAGMVLVVQALVAIGAAVGLSTFPWGFDPLIRVKFWQTVEQAAGMVVAVAGIAALVASAARQINRTATTRRWLTIMSLLIVIPVVAPAGMWGLVKASTPARERERDPNKRDIIISPNFRPSIYVEGTISPPTAITFGPDRKLYIADIAGTIWVASDSTNSGKADSITKYKDGFALITGLIWHDGELYVASSGKIEAFRDTDGNGSADTKRLVVSGLPTLELKPHSNNALAFGPDARLYFGVGSTTEGQVEHNPLAASVLSVNPDGSDLQVFARGFGNPFAVAFNSRGDLFGGDNSPNAEPGTTGDPPDEFNWVVEGGVYGFPYYYGAAKNTPGIRGALISFPAHSVPVGVTFYNGNSFPAEYRDSAFLALWGRGEIQQIEAARAPSGNYVAQTTTFGSGFLYPVAVTVGPDGNLYVADFGTKVIYRISYDPDYVGQK